MKATKATVANAAAISSKITAIANSHSDLPDQASTENKILVDAKESKSIPYKGKFRPKIRYVHQGGRNPHVLTFHGNSLDKLEGSYVRFLGNYFHKKLNLMGTNIKLKFINSKNPYK